MSTFNVLFRIRPGKRLEFIQAMQSIQNSLKTERDLSKSSLFQDVDDPGVFYLIQDWTMQESMERYIRSERFSLLMGVLKVLCTESEIKYQLGSGKPGVMISEI